MEEMENWLAYSVQLAKESYGIPNNKYDIANKFIKKFLNEGGQELLRLAATTVSNRPTKEIAFMMDMPITDCTSVKFVTASNEPVTVQNDCYFIYKNE